MDRLRTWADRILEAAALVGAAALAVEMAVILADVIGQNFGHPLFGALDVSTMAMTVLVFGGMALCDRTGGHIAVDILESRYPAWLNRGVDVVSALLGAVIFLAIAWTLWDSALLSAMLNLRTNILGLPKAAFQYAMIALAVVTALGMLLRALELATTGRDVRRERAARIDPA